VRPQPHPAPHPALTPCSYISMLPVAGVSGTLSDVTSSHTRVSILPSLIVVPPQRFVNTSAQGIVHAKTGGGSARSPRVPDARAGTMTGVNSLSGTVAAAALPPAC
jgi:D-alanyl-D-alanine carboxypeptidase